VIVFDPERHAAGGVAGPGHLVGEVREHLVRVERGRVRRRMQRRLDRVAQVVDRERVARDFTAEQVGVALAVLVDRNGHRSLHAIGVADQ
jgi:hypothetical protein